MKLLYSTIASFIVLFLLGWLFYGVFLTKLMASYIPIMRPASDMKMWAVIVGYIFQSFFLSWIYQKFFQGVSPLKDGFLYGLYYSLLVILPMLFFMWATYQVTYPAAIADAIGMGIRIIIATIVIAYIFGKKEQVAEKS